MSCSAAVSLGLGQSWLPSMPSPPWRGMISETCEVLAWSWSKACWYFHFSVFGPSFWDVWIRGSLVDTLNTGKEWGARDALGSGVLRGS